MSILNWAVLEYCLLCDNFHLEVESELINISSAHTHAPVVKDKTK